MGRARLFQLAGEGIVHDLLQANVKAQVQVESRLRLADDVDSATFAAKNIHFDKPSARQAAQRILVGILQSVQADRFVRVLIAACPVVVRRELGDRPEEAKDMARQVPVGVFADRFLKDMDAAQLVSLLGDLKRLFAVHQFQD